MDIDIRKNRTQKCPLCSSSKIKDFFNDKKRIYLKCSKCNLIFVPEDFLLSPEEEKKRYELHENDPNDENYRYFLSRLFLPMSKLLKPESQGLDFGSGPGPTLSVMFEESGFKMNIYDFFYADDKSVFEKKYDFITASEVLEHLHNPAKEIDLLWSILKPAGYMGIMTKLAEDIDAFSKWHYITDDTHVSFFSRKTFIWIADKLKAELEFIGKDVIILKKPS